MYVLITQYGLYKLLFQNYEAGLNKTGNLELEYVAIIYSGNLKCLK